MIQIINMLLMKTVMVRQTLMVTISNSIKIRMVKSKQIQYSMKQTDISRLTINGAFGNSPEIIPYKNKFIRSLKIIIVSTIIAATAIGLCYVNVIREQKMMLEQKVSLEMQKLDSSIVINATADIISREGNLNSNVALQYSKWIFEYAAKYTVDPLLMVSVMFVESRFDYKAISPTGPIGLFQVASKFHRDKASSAQLFDPKKNIQVGAQILSEYGDLSSSVTETLIRYNGKIKSAPMYAVKVLQNKMKFESEVLAVVAKAV